MGHDRDYDIRSTRGLRLHLQRRPSKTHGHNQRDLDRRIKAASKGFFSKTPFQYLQQLHWRLHEPDVQHEEWRRRHAD